jgi:hypothetical protein
MMYLQGNTTWTRADTSVIRAKYFSRELGKRGKRDCFRQALFWWGAVRLGQ